MSVDLLNSQDDQNDPNSPKANVAGQSAPTNPSQSSQQSSQSVYGGGSGTTPVGTGQTPGAGAARQGGTGFTNLSRIIGANQNNQLGQAVGGGVQRTVGAVRNDIGQAQQQFGQQAQAANVDTDANRQARQNAISQYAYGQQQGSNPAAPTADQIAQFKQFQSGQYNGPQGLANRADLQARAQTAQNLGQSIGSQAGRYNLLNRFVGGKNYTGGERALDSTLLGQTGGDQLKQARRDSAGVGQYAQSQGDLASATAQDYANRAQQFAKDTTNAIGQTAQDYNTALGNKLQQAQTQYGNDYGQIQKDIASGVITQAEADKLGLQNGQYLYDTNLQQLAGLSPTDASKSWTAQDVATQQDLANANALKALGGQYLSGDQTALFNQFTDPNRVGDAANVKAIDALGNTNVPAAQYLQNAQASLTAPGSQYANAVQAANESGGAIGALNNYNQLQTQLNPEVQSYEYAKNQYLAANPGATFDPNTDLVNGSIGGRQINPMSGGTWDNSVTAKQYQDAVNQLNAAKQAAFMGGSQIRNAPFEDQKLQDALNTIDQTRGQQVQIQGAQPTSDDQFAKLRALLGQGTASVAKNPNIIT